MPETVFQVDQREGDLIVTSGEFYAVYFKPVGQPQLILRGRTPTNDHDLLAQAGQSALCHKRTSDTAGLRDILTNDVRADKLNRWFVGTSQVIDSRWDQKNRMLDYCPSETQAQRCPRGVSHPYSMHLEGADARQPQ